VHHAVVVPVESAARLVRRSAKKWKATLVFSVTRSLAAGRGLSRLGSNTDSHSFSRPRIASVSIAPEAAPIARPHFRKPVAV
jgi:hypothetical protein